jgi:hypothetical protein
LNKADLAEFRLLAQEFRDFVASERAQREERQKRLDEREVGLERRLVRMETAICARPLPEACPLVERLLDLEKHQVYFNGLKAGVFGVLALIGGAALLIVNRLLDSLGKQLGWW